MAQTEAAMVSEAVFPRRPDHERIALVLQGGGALGAYQAGAYQALEERGFTPDWIAGTSIGSISGAIIAGNAAGNRVYRLEEFWRTVSHADFWDLTRMANDLRRLYSAWSAMGCDAGGSTRLLHPTAKQSLYPLGSCFGGDDELLRYDCAARPAGTHDRF